MGESCTKLFERGMKNSLHEVCTEQKWCESDMMDGIDYDYSMDRYDALETIKQELLFDISILDRRH
jgi:hypothetical protein